MTKKKAQQFDRIVNTLKVSFDDLNTLLKAERTLHRWCELECGDGNDYASWAIERDEETQIPYMVRHIYNHGHGQDYTTRTKIADREKAALKRIKAICDKLALHFYYQTDCRGCALYVSPEPMQGNNYTNGVAICLD